VKSYVEYLGQTFPYLIRSANTFVAGDVDGDGRVEVASYCAVNNSLNVVSYFEYADASPMWAAATSGQMINAWGFLQTIPPGPNAVAGWTLSSDDQYYPVEFAGGTASLVVFNPATLWIGVVQWSLEGGQMQLVWASQGSSAKYCGLGAADQFFAADLDGDGNQELVQFSPQDQYLFGMAWNGAGFTLVSDSHLTAGPWTLSSTDILLPARVSAGTADQILAFSTTAASAAVLTFSGGALGGTVVNLASGIPAGAKVFAADVDGDGLDEIVAYRSWLAGDLLVLKWNGSAFDVLVQPPSPVNQASQSVMVPLRVSGSGSVLFEYTPINETVSVRTVNASGASIVWSSASTIPGSVWLSAADRFCVADVDGDGNDELIMLSQLDDWLFTLKWNGSEMTGFSSAQSATPGWNVDLLLNAPPTPFGLVPFAGNQETIYQQFSQALYPAVAATVANDGCSSSDIRSCYKFLAVSDFINLQSALNAYYGSLSAPDADAQAVDAALTNDFIYGYISDSLDSGCGSDIRSKYLGTLYKYRDSFATLATDITGGPHNPPLTPLPGAPAAAWTAMSTQLAGELNGLDPVIFWSGSECMTGLNTQLQNAQTAAMSQAVDNVNQTVVAPLTSTTGPYWWANCIDAVLWGLSAVPAIGVAVPALPAVLAMGATLFPAVIGGFNPTSPPPPEEISYGEFAGNIATAYNAAAELVAEHATAIMSDLVLLPLLGGLFNGTPTNSGWTFTLDEVPQLAAAAGTPALLQYYSVFIPMRFNFLILENCKSSSPYYCAVRDVYQGMKFYQQIGLGAPSNAYMSVPTGNGTWNIYLLCTGTDPSSVDFPGADMMTDLMTNLNVSPQDFFMGNGLWSTIPRSAVSLPC
jgi:hypothetical protein